MTMTQAEMQDQIIAKAAGDDEFRARLLADPRDAIRSLNGASLPDALTIEVHEASATTFHLVLPPGSQLTEKELEQVFGGDWATDFINAVGGADG